MPTYLPARIGISQSAALAEAYASATATDPELITIALYHDTFLDEAGAPTAIYCVNDWSQLLATIEAGADVHASKEVTFNAIPFKFVRPEEADGAAPPEVVLEIDNVSREIVAYIRAAAASGKPVSMTVRVYLASDTTAPHEMPPMTLILRNVTVTNSTISARAGYGDIVNRRFPTKHYTGRTHPGLIAG